MLSDKTILILNTLLYPVICTKKPMEDVDWVRTKMIDCPSPKFSKKDILAAIDEIPSTTEWFTELASRGDHSETIIRQFLQELKRQIR